MGKKKIVLVRCEVPTRVRDAFIPNNLLTLSQRLIQSGYSPILIDMRVEDFRPRLKSIDWEQVVAVGISTLTGPQIRRGLEFASGVRRIDPSIPIIWGGAHPSLRPAETVRHPLCDFVVRGEGEETLSDLADRLARGDSIDSVKGITYLHDGEIRETPDREWLDLDSIGPLPYDLLDIGRYDLSSGFVYHSSRGCPHKCGFCINHALHKCTYRAQSARTVVENVSNIVESFGAKTIHFSDDNFFVNKKRAEDVCRLIIEKNLRIGWVAGCRFDYFAKFSAEFLSLLKESGCRSLGYGAESGSRRILTYVRKEIIPEQVVKSVRMAREVGLRLSPVSFMYGFPGESYQDLLSTVDLIDQIRMEGQGNTVVNGMFLLTPYPGTPIAKDLESKGYRFPERLEDWSSYLMSGGQKRTNWVDPEYLKEANTVSSIVRFRFFLDTNVHRKLRPSILKLLYFVFILPFYLSEKVRWKNRWFRGGCEWRLWAWIRTKFLGVT